MSTVCSEELETLCGVTKATAETVAMRTRQELRPCTGSKSLRSWAGCTETKGEGARQRGPGDTYLGAGNIKDADERRRGGSACWLWTLKG